MSRRTRYLRIRCHLRDEPEVLTMAAALGLDPDHVVGLLVRFWDWATGVSTNGRLFVDGLCREVMARNIDRAVGLENFGGALLSVGWLKQDGDAFVIPEYDRWLSQAALDRAYKAEWMKERRGAPSRGLSVDQKFTREREREREEALSAGALNADGEPQIPAKDSAKKPAKKRKPFAQDAPPGEQPIDTVACQGDPGSWSLYPSKVAELAGAFPGLDVAAELKRAFVWLRQSPANRKTAQGMTRFIWNWLVRSCAKPGASAGTPRGLFDRPPPATPEELREIGRRQEEQYGSGEPGGAGKPPAF